LRVREAWFGSEQRFEMIETHKLIVTTETQRTSMRSVRIVAVTLCLSFSALAIETSLSGIVKDPGGAVFEKLPVAITNTSTGKKIEVKTQRDGTFGPISLPSGEYKVQIQTKCFKKYSRTIMVSDGETSRLDISLIRTCPRDLHVE
jgi:uncharacterized membrane protein